MRILHLMGVAAVAVTMASPTMAAHWHWWNGNDKPAVSAVAPTYGQSGSDGAAPSHAGGVRPAICDASGPTSGYNRPGGFCEIAMNPRSLSDKVKGVKQLTPGSAAQPYMYFCESDWAGSGGYFTNIYNRFDGKKGCYN